MKILPVNKTTFGMNFELSQETLDLISKKTGMSIEELRSKPLNEPLHHDIVVKQHFSKLDILPKNVYLQMGRILKLEDVNECLDTLDMNIFEKFIHKLKKIFTK